MNTGDKRPSVTEDNLRSALPMTFGNASRISVLQLAGDASSRSYYRIESPESSRSFVLQCSESFPAASSASHPYLSALALLKSLKVAAPTCIEISPENGWVLLEDLGDETLQKHMTLPFYRRAVDWVVDWTVEIERKRQNNDAFPGPHLGWAFDFEKLDFEMRHTARYLIKEFFKKDADKFLGLVHANSDYLAVRPRFFCHRDYHCRNLMMKSGELYVIDFQDARMGPITYDIVSLLWDPYVNLDGAWKDELLAYWKKGLLVKAGADATRVTEVISAQTELAIELERMKIQRLLKAAGSYASFLATKGRRDYLPGIEPALRDTMDALVRLDALGAARSADEELLTLLQGLSGELPAILI
jgi:aminoglycoside/choline kinase family phosphotransferase